MAQLDPFVVELLGLLILSPPGLLAAVRPIVDYATEQSAMMGFPLGEIVVLGFAKVDGVSRALESNNIPGFHLAFGLT